MQIHFYHQWDKPSSANVQSNRTTIDSETTTVKKETSFFSKIDKIRSINPNLALIVLGILATFFFSYLIFANHSGQASFDGTFGMTQKTGEMFYTVQSGDTLWSIANRHYPHLMTEEAIIQIQQTNGFKGATIQAGQTILLP
ncbi:hypothetical protein BEP19_09595 [Ammoniphilus oxalaticus]|uniref:LysM domain-containing protein n=1 Tax=Ammoniphilus oxalaticus TaxID=66863 RepID=A0A419SKS7_9BACL|nr:LysM peptidoglycan-binding domain-containing protein [Ammoniphilus oxalaticus]RKD24617.1 hypothetical protein BEP19_09595 [Ammoniphilus oxalaticus]